MEIHLNSKRIFLFQIYFILFLLLANISGLIFKFGLDHDFIFGLVPLFDFNGELNIPAFYSFSAIGCCSILLFLIAMSNKNYKSERLYWFGLAAIFLFSANCSCSCIIKQLLSGLPRSVSKSAVTSSSPPSIPKPTL